MPVIYALNFAQYLQIALLLGAIGFIYLTVLRFVYNRETAQIRERRQAMNKNIPAKFSGKNVPDFVGQWETEIHELGRQIVGQIDTKLALLRALTQEANRTILELEAIIEKKEEDKSPMPEKSVVDKKESILDELKEELSQFDELETEMAEADSKTVLTPFTLPKFEPFSAIQASAEEDEEEQAADVLPFPVMQNLASIPRTLMSSVPQKAENGRLEFRTASGGSRLMAELFPRAAVKEQKGNAFMAAPKPQLNSLFLGDSQPKQTVPLMPAPPAMLQSAPPAMLQPAPPAILQEDEQETHKLKVQMLANYGYSANDIAKQLSLPLQLVEKILWRTDL